MALCNSWVERIHARLLVRYGTAWLRMWEGIDPKAVQADWAEELAGFEQNPNAIKHGLANLPPEKPPTVEQFKTACLRAPQVGPKALPAPLADAAVVAAVVGAVRRAEASDPKEWAHALRRREQQCEQLTIAQRAMWRAALQQEGSAV